MIFAFRKKNSVKGVVLTLVYDIDIKKFCEYHKLNRLSTSGEIHMTLGEYDLDEETELKLYEELRKEAQGIIEA